MQEENRSTRRKTCGSKFELETKWTYSAETGNQNRAQWSTARRKYRYTTCFPQYVNKTCNIFFYFVIWDILIWKPSLMVSSDEIIYHYLSLKKKGKKRIVLF